MLNIKQSVMQSLANTLNLKQIDNINEHDSLKDLGLDSMSSLIFLMKLEENIPGFIIDPDTLDGDALETVASITAYIENQCALNAQQVA